MKAVLAFFAAAFLPLAAFAATPQAQPSPTPADAGAQFELGRACLNGLGVPQDDAKAAALFRQAAGLGSAKAQHNLGAMYAAGRGGIEAGEAVQWLTKAAGQGLPQSQFLLAEILRRGKGVPANLGGAIAWYEKAAAQGMVEAQSALGEIYYFGNGDVKPDYAAAARWFGMAAAQNDPNAQNSLAVLYESGDGVKADEARAVELFRKSAMQGNAKAQASLGRLYYSGIGVKADRIEAYAWLTLASRQGEAAADNLLRDFAVPLSKQELESANARAEKLAAGIGKAAAE